ncbi:MAG: hypothetical protein IJE09_01380 [Oscillospiraceae bacterium]|nr:hypothetical protein [Oscillospiraceae bacterium]
MKKFTKILSMVLLVAMCVSMFAVSASAAAVHVKQTSDTPAADGSVTYTVSNPGGAAITDVSWNTADGAVSADGYWSLDGSTLTVSGSDWSVVSSVSVSFSNGLSVDVACAMGEAGYANDGSSDPTPAPHTHSWTDVAATEGNCQVPGTKAHSVCSCGAYLVDFVETTDASALNAGYGEHDWQYVAAVEATCQTTGYEEHAKCSVCGALRQHGVDIANKSDLAVTVGHNYVDGICSYCGGKEPVVKVFAITGDSSIDYSSATNFRYQVADPSAFTLSSISAGGYNLVRGAGFSYDSWSGTIVVEKAALSAIIDGKSSIELVFTATDGSTVRGFVITNSENIVVDDLYISGLSQNKYIRESGKDVSFQTNLTDPSCIKIFSTTTQMDVPTSGYTFTKAYGDVYTYSFKNSFLDTLDCGYYEIRCYYGNSNAEYVTPGTLMISDSNTTEGLENVLYFTNSTQGADDYFKYVSGDEVPRMHCELFLIDGARLQVSTNGGKSWSNVNVHNYYVEPNKKGNDTSHAWIGADYLDSLNADTIYYFRVVVPASVIHAGQDLVSNTVSITTGPTLKAVDTAKHVINSTKNLRFVSSEKIAKVYVGNVQLTDENDFNVSNDGKTVTLSPSFLNKRTAGSTYTIKVLTKNGEYASTTFQILTTAQASASPRTGDTSNIGLWTAVLMLSAGAGVAVLPRLKKED